MKNLILSLSFLLCMYLSGRAQTGDSTVILHHEVGINTSTISGIGVFYSYNLGNQLSIKAVGMVYNEMKNNSQSRSDFFSILGLEIQHNLTYSQASRLYAFAGASYWYEQYKWDSEITTYETVNIGAGLGFEFRIWEHLCLNMNFGFQKENESQNPSFESYTPYSRIGMGGGASIGYQF